MNMQTNYEIEREYFWNKNEAKYARLSDAHFRERDF